MTRRAIPSRFRIWVLETWFEALGYWHPCYEKHNTRASARRALAELRTHYRKHPPSPRFRIRLYIPEQRA